MRPTMNSNTFVSDDGKQKELREPNEIFRQLDLPVDRASCFEERSPMAGLIDRRLNERMSIERHELQFNRLTFISSLTREHLMQN